MFSFFNLLAISYPQMFLLAKWLLINIGYNGSGVCRRAGIVYCINIIKLKYKLNNKNYISNNISRHAV